MHAGGAHESPPRSTATNATFSWPVRVYWEDTDAGGIVYYANYLRFFERARSEWLRALGIDQEALRRTSGLAFVVAEAGLHYHRPARLDDRLDIDVAVARLGRASIDLQQAARRDGELLVEARVRIGCVRLDGLVPSRLPGSLMEQLQPLRT